MRGGYDGRQTIKSPWENPPLWLPGPLGIPGPKGSPGETAPVDEAAVASLIEQMQEQSEAGLTAEPVPLKSTPSDYTKSFVRHAIGRYESDGLEATLAYYNTKESIDGQWYTFIMDQENVMLAHAANPDLVGRPVSAAVGPNGYPAGELVAAVADEDGAWFDYTFTNPATGVGETKHSWIVRHWSLVQDGMKAGRAIRPRLVPQAFVRQALDVLDLEATLAYYNTKESIDGQWYTFIMDQENVMLAHAANPDLVGRPVSAAVGPNGYPAGELVAAVADKDGAWFDYTFTNPATGVGETKHSWIVPPIGLVFGSGWYESGPRKSDAPAYTKAVVQQALNLYDALGLEAAVDYYSSQESVSTVSGTWFIVDEDGYTIAHHNPMFLRRDPSLRVDAAGYFYGDDLLGATEAGRWVDYVLLNPESGEDQQKHTWIVRHDGLLFASGWYE